jgi:hypothetical protein
MFLAASITSFIFFRDPVVASIVSGAIVYPVIKGAWLPINTPVLEVMVTFCDYIIRTLCGMMGVLLDGMGANV